MRPVGAELFHPEVRMYMTKLTAKTPAQKRRTVSTKCTGPSVRLVQYNTQHLLPVQD